MENKLFYCLKKYEAKFYLLPEEDGYLIKFISISDSFSAKKRTHALCLLDALDLILIDNEASILTLAKFEIDE